MYRDLRDQNTVFTGLVAQFGPPATLTVRERSERVNAVMIGLASAVLGVVAFGAGSSPARHAARVQPVRALRSE